jgi:hypothetical protein
MSEDRAHFKVKKGDIEIEYQGDPKEVASKFEGIFEWIKTAPVIKAPKEPVEPPTPADEEKADKRGGARTGVISPAIDELVKEGFLKEFKTASQVHEELRRKAVPVSDVHVVMTALNRRVPKKLDRIKDEQGRWVYRKKT